MRLDMRGVDGKFIRDHSSTRDLLEYPTPDALTSPSIVAVVECGARSISRREIAPTTPRLQDVQDATNHPTIIDPTSAGPAMR